MLAESYGSTGVTPFLTLRSWICSISCWMTSMTNVRSLPAC